MQCETIELTQETINTLFEDEEREENPHQSNILNELYKIAYPDWEQITKIIGYPKISKTTNLYISKKFMQFDKTHHPQVLNGGLWMNKGFSTDNDLKDWKVKPAPALRSE